MLPNIEQGGALHLGMAVRWTSCLAPPVRRICHFVPKEQRETTFE